MTKRRDARSLPHDVLEEMRRLAVQRALAGETQTEIARSLDVHHDSVSKWVRAYRAEGNAAARPVVQRGRPVVRRPDVDTLFREYEASMERVAAANPRTRILHVTSPVTELEGGPKGLVKRVLGRRLEGFEQNFHRERFSDLIRARYGPEGAVFDIAAFEASIDEWGGCKDLPLEALVREVELFAAIDNSTVRDYNESTLLNGQAKMELNTRIAELRNKVVAGTVTREELREAYAALRAARTSASVIREKKKAAEAKPDGAALLAKLAALGSK